VAKDATRAAAERRLVVFDGHGAVSTPCWQRGALAPDQRLAGPLVVEEFGSTTVVPPGFTLTVDRLGNLVLQRGAA
jgi:N-methylhydantoinase A